MWIFLSILCALKSPGKLHLAEAGSNVPKMINTYALEKMCTGYFWQCGISHKTLMLKICLTG